MKYLRGEQYTQSFGEVHAWPAYVAHARARINLSEKQTDRITWSYVYAYVCSINATPVILHDVTVVRGGSLTIIHR